MGCTRNAPNKLRIEQLVELRQNDRVLCDVEMIVTKYVDYLTENVIFSSERDTADMQRLHQNAPNCTRLRLPDCTTTGLHDCQVARLSDCTSTRLHDWRIARLPDCTTAGLPQIAPNCDCQIAGCQIQLRYLRVDFIC